MANTIRIARSVTTNTPVALAQGEVAYSESASPNGLGELFIGTAGPTITKITTSLLTGVDGVAAQPNSSAQNNQTITSGLGIGGAEAGSAGNVTLSFAPAELTAVALAATDWMVFEDATHTLPKRSLISTTNLGLFNNNLGWTSNLGTVTAVTGGVGVLSTGGTAPDISLDFSELTNMVGAISGTTEFILQDGVTESRKAASGIQLEFFNNTTSRFVSETDSIVVLNWNWVLDEDTMASNSAVHVPTQQSVKAYVDATVTGGMVYRGGFDPTAAAGAGSPNLNTISSTTGDTYTVTVAGTYNWTTGSAVLEVGDVLVAEATGILNNVASWTILQNNIGASSETAAGYIELATQAEMDTATDDLRAVTPLKYANSVIDGGTF